MFKPRPVTPLAESDRIPPRRWRAARQPRRAATRASGLRWEHDDATRARALVADDDDAMRALMGLVLKGTGFDVVEVASAEALYQRAKTDLGRRSGPSAPDLIVTDLRMGGATGLDFLTALRTIDWTTPVILVSAFVDERVTEEAESPGASAVLAKPFDIAELRQHALRFVSGGT